MSKNKEEKLREDQREKINYKKTQKKFLLFVVISVISLILMSQIQRVQLEEKIQPFLFIGDSVEFHCYTTALKLKIGK